THIVDALECVVSLFFSNNVRHNLRAAYILCDELVEITCRHRAKQIERGLGRANFHELLKHRGVKLNPKTTALGSALQSRHETRNNMQHESPAGTVDIQHCADAILDAVEAMENCFHGTKAELPPVLKVALRTARVFSRQGGALQRTGFVRAMQACDWRGL